MNWLSGNTVRQIGVGTGKPGDPYSETSPYSSMNNSLGETLRVKPRTQASAILSCEMPVDTSVVSFQVSSVGVGDRKTYRYRYKITSGFPFVAFCSRKQCQLFVITRWPYEDVSNWSLAGEPNQKKFSSLIKTQQMAVGIIFPVPNWVPYHEDVWGIGGVSPLVFHLGTVCPPITTLLLFRILKMGLLT